jgi:hypothetical protein
MNAKTGERDNQRECIDMADHLTTFRKRLARSLAAMALLSICAVGGSALLLGASSTPALAFGHGGHGGGFGGHGGFGGFRGGGFRGGGFGFYGYGYPYGYGGYYPPYYGDAGVCYVVRQRVMTRYGWRIRRVSVCE